MRRFLEVEGTPMSIALATLLVFTGLVDASQVRAPKGGITINGKFYKGGQFIPGSAYVAAPAVEPEPTPAPARVTPRRKPKSADLSKIRGDSTAAARSRAKLSAGKNLLKSGKTAAARLSLREVIKLDANPDDVSAAYALLGEKPPRAGPATAPSNDSAAGPVPAVSTARPTVGTSASAGEVIDDKSAAILEALAGANELGRSRLVAFSGQPAEEVERRLNGLVEAGRVSPRSMSFGDETWAIADAGRKTLEAWRGRKGK